MAPVLAPVLATTLRAPSPAPGALVEAIRSDRQALVYFLLNVGDGDSQLLLLPPNSNDKVRRLVIVDVATAKKMPALIDALHNGDPAEPIIEPPGQAGQIPLLVATHPHGDHIGGMKDLFARYNNPHACIDQFWDPGYFFPSPTFHQLMTELEQSPWIRRLQPTSGTTLYLDSVKITVLGPGVGLRTRFDTYGVDPNDASLTLMIDYPAAPVYSKPDNLRDARTRATSSRQSQRLLLGGDAQFLSWAQASVDFPDLKQTQNPVLAKELRVARGNRDYLSANVFKLSHHASKHGINLELLERVGAKYSLVSSVSGGGSYNFPHSIAMEAVREAREPLAKSGAARSSDHALGIHATSAVLDDANSTPLGSIALVVSSRSSIRMFRLMDRRSDSIDLTMAREVVNLGQ